MDNTKEIVSFFEKLDHLRILVVGDVMLDHYIWGKVERISPEAPVPVVNLQAHEYRLGGAANVALNLNALGIQAPVLGLVGKDAEARILKDLLFQYAPAEHILVPDDRPTTTKTRVMGNGRQQILRIDAESTALYVDSFDWEKILEEIKPNAVVFEDYDKGLISTTLIADFNTANVDNIPVLVDPKRNNFFAYQNVTLFKPNLDELNRAMGLNLAKTDVAGILQAVKTLRERMQHRYTLITLSEEGMLFIDSDFMYRLIPAHKRKVHDVSGAGDTVIAIMAAALAAKLNPILATQLANIAGGLVCEEIGVVPIQAKKLYAEALRLLVP